MCSHQRPCALYAGLVTTLNPPPQQVLTVSWAWPGRDNRGQSTRSVPMETSAQDEELTKKKKKKKKKPPCKGHEGNKKDKSNGASWWAGQTALLRGGDRNDGPGPVGRGLSVDSNSVNSNSELSGFRVLCHLVPRLTL